MTTLVVEDLMATALTQDFVVKRRKVVDSCRMNLLFVNDPAGTYTCAIKDGSTTLATDSLTMAEIISNGGFTASQHHHGFFQFEFDTKATLNPERTYTIEFSASGYTFNASSFVSWILPHENLVNTTIDESFTSDFQKPRGYQLWGF